MPTHNYDVAVVGARAAGAATACLLARSGLRDEVIAAGTPPVRRTTFRYANTVVPIPIKSSHGVDALYAPRRTVLDPILVDAADRAGVDVRFGIVVTDVERTSH